METPVPTANARAQRPEGKHREPGPLQREVRRSALVMIAAYCRTSQLVTLSVGKPLRDQTVGSLAAARHCEPDGHSTTWSARNRSDGGIVRPSAFAALMLITNSNLVGCSMGKSAGLAPRRILST